MPQGVEYPHVLKQCIRAMLHLGHSVREVRDALACEKLYLGLATIQRCREVQPQAEKAQSPETSRKRKISERDVRQIQRLVQHERGATAEYITQVLSLPVHPSTTRRAMAASLYLHAVQAASQGRG